MVLGIDFLKDVDSFWVAKRSQVGSKIVPKIDPGGVLGVSWWVLGGSWGPRPNNAMRNPFFGVLLGAFWGRLGGYLGRSWGHLGLQDGAKSPKKTISKSSYFLIPLGRAIFCDTGGFLMPKWCQNYSQIILNFDMVWQTPILLNFVTVSRISLIFWDWGDGFWKPKRVQNRFRNRIRKARPMEIGLYEMLMDFGCQVGPENPIRSSQIRSDQIRSGQIRSDQIRSGQIRSDQIRSGQVRPGQI